LRVMTLDVLICFPCRVAAVPPVRDVHAVISARL